MEKENYAHETIMTLEEGSELLNFFNRVKLADGSYNAKDWKYLTTGEILTQQKQFHSGQPTIEYSGNVIGNDIFVAMLDNSYLTLCHCKDYLVGKEGVTFDRNQTDFGDLKYSQSRNLKDSKQFWPFYNKFGIPEDFKRELKDDINNKNSSRSETFLIKTNEGSNGLILDKDHFEDYFKRQFNCASLGGCSNEATINGKSGAYLQIDRFSKIGESQLIPLAPTIYRGNFFALTLPYKHDSLYLQHNVEGGLIKALFDEEVRPQDLGNGVFVFSNVPKYLQRVLGTNNWKNNQGVK